MNSTRFLFSIFISLLFISSFAQPHVEFEIKKPVKYENRKLRSEKTGEKKFTLPRRLMQNTVTHYNYYFNANNRLNEVINRAKTAFRNDYSSLLPFYNYTLEATSRDKSELDSVVYKCTAGILLHDLRNDWIDNMYLLLGKAYLFRNDLDSAAMTFQYINFAYAPKEEGGYDIPIGSNASNAEGVFSISTKEKKSVLNGIVKRPPSRNESFVWQIRNSIEKGDLPDAAGLIEILRNDPNFPGRLKSSLNETIAYWFYKQQVYDSSAFYLSKALDEADTKADQARWEYLTAQLYQLSGQKEKALEFYNRSIQHTNDPIMEVYARLNSISINGGDNENFVQKNIDELVKMAKRDKYQNYRDIIYYAAASIEADRKNFNGAQDFLLKSAKYSFNNPVQRSRTFMFLGDLNYDRKTYPVALRFYDSTDENQLNIQADKDRLTSRKPALKIIAEDLSSIETEDSLQALASMPADQREAILKKKVKQFRREKGLKEDESQGSNPAILARGRDLFDDSKSSEFYFYNASLKARGFNKFRNNWGQRNNVDNWRRQSAINRMPNLPGTAANTNNAEGAAANQADETSYEGLLNKLPLTEDKLAASNQIIMDALFTDGKTFAEKLEDYPSAIAAYEELLRRFPQTPRREEVMFNLIYAYGKTGDREKSDFYKKGLLNASSANKWVQLLKNPGSGKATVENSPATKRYQDIYNLFIEGNFDEAKTQKRSADSIYGNTYWTPQLLFIESIYYVKQREDSTAIQSLTNLTRLYSNSPMAAKAETMIDVLKRRNEIESYLTNLNVTRNEDEIVAVTEPQQPQVQPKVEKKVDQPQQPSIQPKTEKIEPPVTLQPKVEKPVNQPPTQPKTEQPNNQTPSVAKKEPPVITRDSVPVTPTPKAPTIVNKTFTFVPSDPHYVMIVMDKVDVIYASEAKNAFNRFNRERYSSQKIDMGSLKLDDRFQLVLQGPFADAGAAVAYVDKTRPVTGSRILPWLTPDKYSFQIISAANLEVLKNTKDMTAYRELLHKAFPDKF